MVTPPSGPPPPTVPEGWKAHWNPDYKAWFYENIYTDCLGASYRARLSSGWEEAPRRTTSRIRSRTTCSRSAASRLCYLSTTSHRRLAQPPGAPPQSYAQLPYNSTPPPNPASPPAAAGVRAPSPHPAAPFDPSQPNRDYYGQPQGQPQYPSQPNYGAPNGACALQNPSYSQVQQYPPNPAYSPQPGYEQQPQYGAPAPAPTAAPTKKGFFGGLQNKLGKLPGGAGGAALGAGAGILAGGLLAHEWHEHEEHERRRHHHGGGLGALAGGMLGGGLGAGFSSMKGFGSPDVVEVQDMTVVQNTTVYDY